MTVGAVYDGAPEVDFFSLHNRKQKTIDVEMLDYAYVAKCGDVDELKGILALLRSGKEGRYPALEKATEDRILAVLPSKERVKIECMRSGPSDNELMSEKEKLASWTTQADAMHKALQDQKSGVSGRHLPPVRGQKVSPEPTQIEAPKAKPLIAEVGVEPNLQKKAIPAYDFRAWEMYDVDKAIHEIDECEQRAQEQARLRREENEKRERDRKKELASLPAYVDVDSMSEPERKVLARVEKEKGNDSFRANENETAVLYYTRSMAFDDSEAALYSNRAAAHLRLKNFAQAEDDCSRALLLDPLYGKACRRRGMTRFRRGKYAEAIEDFKHSLELEPGNVEVEKLLKKTIAKWKEVDGTVDVAVSENQTTHSMATSAKVPLQQTAWASKPSSSTETAKPFKRFEIIEEDDEDDDANAPVEQTDDDEEHEEEDQKPFQRFEIIEE